MTTIAAFIALCVTACPGRLKGLDQPRKYASAALAVLLILLAGGIGDYTRWNQRLAQADIRDRALSERLAEIRGYQKFLSKYELKLEGLKDAAKRLEEIQRTNRIEAAETATSVAQRSQ